MIRLSSKKFREISRDKKKYIVCLTGRLITSTFMRRTRSNMNLRRRSRKASRELDLTEFCKVEWLADFQLRNFEDNYSDENDVM